MKHFNQQIFFILFLVFVTFFVFLTRLWKLDALPVAPYEEEVAVGYDAYSLLKTGKDHHGQTWPILAFESFGDFKPTGYAYATLPSLAIFDLSVWSIRLPSALAGIFIIINLIMLARLLKISWRWVAVVSVFSPWLIFFSRASWESNLATSLILAGVVVLWGSWRARQFWLTLPGGLIGTGFLVLATYTYHSARATAPLIFFGLLVLLFTEYLQNQTFSNHSKNKTLSFLNRFLNLWKTKDFRKKIIFPITIWLVFFLFSFWPILANVFSPAVSQRSQETTFINTAPILERSLELQEAGELTWIDSKIFHPYIITIQKIVDTFFIHLSPRFLFVEGDINPRHSSGYTALLFWTDAFAMIVGSIWFWQNKKRYFFFLFWWLAVAILPASITKDASHALRILAGSPVLITFVATGYWQVAQFFSSLWLKFAKNRMVVIGRFAPSLIIFSLIMFQWSGFWWFYTQVYPTRYASVWQTGNQEMVEKVIALQKVYPEHRILLSREGGRPLMYYFFFGKIDPESVQSEAQEKDQKGELTVFQNVHVFDSLPNDLQKSILVLSDRQAKNFNHNLAIEKFDVTDKLNMQKFTIYVIN